MIELLVSIAIFGVVSVTFLGALVAGYRGIIIAHDQTMAESLTRTAMEESHQSFPCDAVPGPHNRPSSIDVVAVTPTTSLSRTTARIPSSPTPAATR